MTTQIEAVAKIVVAVQRATEKMEQTQRDFIAAWIKAYKEASRESD